MLLLKPPKMFFMRKLLWFSTLLVFLLSVLSCGKSKDKKEVDAADPILTITLPDNDYQYISGGTNRILFSGSVSDDLALEKLVVTLTWHGTTKSAEIDGDGTVTSVYDPWPTQTETIALSGKSQTFTTRPLFDKTIPDNIKRGYYKLTFELTDLAKKKVTIERIVEII